MRICLMTPSFLPAVGGMEVVVDRLAKQFQAAGHEVLVVTKRPSKHEPLPDLPYDVACYRKTRSSIWCLGPQRRILLQEHRRRPFDIIHAQAMYPSGYVAVGVGKQLNVPIVLTSHVGDIRPGSRYRRRWLPRRRMIWAMKNAAAVTGVSVVLKEIVDELTDGQAHSYAIPNGIDAPLPPPQQPPPDLSDLAGRPFMITLGRLHPNKGLSVLLDAMGILQSRGTAVPQLVLVGDGPLRAELEAQASRLNLQQAVRFAGLRQGPEKNWLLHACRFFLQPSIVEGMPLTVGEAMAAGKCVLGTDIGGTRELIRHGVDGFLAAPGDATAYADALAELASRSEQLGLADIEQAALASAHQRDWASVAKQYLSLFESVRSRRGNERSSI